MIVLNIWTDVRFMWPIRVYPRGIEQDCIPHSKCIGGKWMHLTSLFVCKVATATIGCLEFYMT